MSEITFNKIIQSIHKEIQGKLKKTNNIIDHYLISDIPIIPKLGQYFFKQEENSFDQYYAYYLVR